MPCQPCSDSNTHVLGKQSCAQASGHVKQGCAATMCFNCVSRQPCHVAHYSARFICQPVGLPLHHSQNKLLPMLLDPAHAHCIGRAQIAHARVWRLLGASLCLGTAAQEQRGVLACQSDHDSADLHSLHCHSTYTTGQFCTQP